MPCIPCSQPETNSKIISEGYCATYSDVGYALCSYIILKAFSHWAHLLLSMLALTNVEMDIIAVDDTIHTKCWCLHWLWDSVPGINGNRQWLTLVVDATLRLKSQLLMTPDASVYVWYITYAMVILAWLDIISVSPELLSTTICDKFHNS